MMSDSVTIVETKKDPRRVEAGKKGAEVRKMKAELRRKEAEAVKKENDELKSITMVEDTNVYKNYIPLCITIFVVGFAGLYMFKPVKKETPIEIPQKKEIDPFEFN